MFFICAFVFLDFEETKCPLQEHFDTIGDILMIPMWGKEVRKCRKGQNNLVIPGLEVNAGLG